MARKLHPLALGASYAGALLGAGFLSGREIVQFFTIYGRAGLLGILFSTIGFSYLGWAILEKGNAHETSNYHALIQRTLGAGVAKLAAGFIFLLLLGVATVAVAGGAAVVKEILGMEGFGALGSTLLAVALLLILGPGGLATLNLLLLPALLLAAVSLVDSLSSQGSPYVLITTLPAGMGGPWFLSALLYLSYNSILAMGFLAALAERTGSTRERAAAGISGGLTLGALLLLADLALLSRYPETLSQEIPMLWLITDLWTGPVPRLAYSLLLWGGLLGTAAAATYALGKNLAHRRESPLLWSLGALLFAALMAPIGFTRLIATVYPIAGALGLLLLIPLALAPHYR